MKCIRYALSVSFISSIVCLSAFCGPDLSRYDALRTPAISQKEARTMMVIEMKGDPAQTSGAAISRLFKLYYQVKGSYKNFPEGAPIGRWTNTLTDPRDQWVGIFGLPAAPEMKTLPDEYLTTEPKVRLETWQYGDVAEILHVGPYSAETPTIEKLKEFIKKSGYEISGAHEEEYLQGPGWIFKGDENEYRTIIRYPVKKAAR